MIKTPPDARSAASHRSSRIRDLTDEVLLLKYRSSGNAAVFTELVRRYEGQLYGYLRRFLQDIELAKDAFQQTFLQVHLKCGQFQAGRKVRPWLYAIATNQAIDAQRRNRRHRMMSLDVPRHETAGDDQAGRLLDLLTQQQVSPIARLELEEQCRWVRKAIAELPAGLRAAVMLVYFQGLRYREAAEVLSIPVGTVKSRVHSAIVKLYEAWTQSE